MKKQQSLKAQNKGQIVIYTPKGRKKGIQVKLEPEKETIWLSLDQIAQLFNRDKGVVSRHLKNIYDSRELSKNSTVAKNATVQIEGGRKITRNIEYYNLDAILSVGYRVNSKQGVAFRIWATKTLKEYLVKGYALNEKRLKEREDTLKDLEKTMGFMKSLLQERKLSSDESSSLLHVITDYSYAIATLDAYDHKTLKIEKVSTKKGEVIDYEKALKVISQLKIELIKKKQATELFGKERQSGQFESSLNTIYQTFGGKDLYPSLEEKAANLLYLIIKNHPFIDGNKRSGAFLFIWFLEINKILYTKDGSKRIADNALISLALLVAESKSQDKDIVISLIVNLINKRNT